MEALNLGDDTKRTFSELVEGQAQAYACALSTTIVEARSPDQWLREEFKRYLPTGSSYSKASSQPAVGTAKPNPTLLHPSSGKWTLHHSTAPFLQYGPFSLRELNQQGDGPGALTRLCKDRLAATVRAYQSKPV